MSKVSLTLEEEMDIAITMNSYTKDMLYLTSSFKKVPVFVYGQEKFGFKKHNLVDHRRPMGLAWTERKDFMLCDHKNGPITFFTGNDGSKLPQERVQGEIFLVPPSTVAYLDSFYECGRAAIRSWRYFYWYDPATGPKHWDQMNSCGAYMYLASPAYWNENGKNSQLKEAGMMTSPREHNEPFYYYAKSDQPAGK